MIKEKHKRYDSEGNDNAGGMDKIRTKLKTFYRDRNIRETEKMKSVLRELETTSQLKK